MTDTKKEPMPIGQDTNANYRVTFGGEQIDYRNGFEECRKYFPVIKRIRATAKEDGIEDIWWFFEPFVEITWIDRRKDGPFLDTVAFILHDEGIVRYKTFSPTDGQFADWFGKTPQERRLGYKRYAKLAELSEMLLENQDIIEEGMGFDAHLTRCTHTIANQLGMNYMDEGMALFKRSILCFLYFFAPKPQIAIDTWEKLFNEKFQGG